MSTGDYAAFVTTYIDSNGKEGVSMTRRTKVVSRGGRISFKEKDGKRYRKVALLDDHQRIAKNLLVILGIEPDYE